jgi:hypothetical protein
MKTSGACVDTTTRTHHAARAQCSVAGLANPDQMIRRLRHVPKDKYVDARLRFDADDYSPRTRAT